MKQFHSSDPTSLDALGRILAQASNAAQITRSFNGRYLGSIRGVITSVDDPEDTGKVLVATKNSPDFTTQWIPFNTGINGKQPPNLVGSEVLLTSESGNPQELVVTSVLNSGYNSVSRLAIYPQSSLPVCDESNKGYQTVVETEGNDYLVVCLNRNGRYLWVSPSDLSHIHVKGDRVNQNDDSDGDTEQPVSNDDLVSLDLVVNTTDEQYSRNSKNFNTEPTHYGGF
jgi:hypothetical protein